MFKFLFFTFLILWLSYKIAGFVIRTFLKSAGFTVNGKQAGQGSARKAANQATQKPEPQRHVTDNLGDYIDFEEVK
jgi:hypothetical protein